MTEKQRLEKIKIHGKNRSRVQPAVCYKNFISRLLECHILVPYNAYFSLLNVQWDWIWRIPVCFCGYLPRFNCKNSSQGLLNVIFLSCYYFKPCHLFILCTYVQMNLQTYRAYWTAARFVTPAVWVFNTLKDV